ncbi:lycopene cyclase domain-containing protein [Brevibacterium litoralis]|uniref:lycopene cyclase domain-containing protein n=1 Tax=Brevibacterium litoralis TaxID=3138935 RepID=UPI0032EF352E
MTYTLVNLVFLALAVAVAVPALRGPRASARPSRSRGALHRAPRLSVTALLATGALLVALTIVFDNLMILAGFVEYGEAQTSGIRIGVMPIEDLAYTVFAVLWLPALWTLLGRRKNGVGAPGVQGTSAAGTDAGQED